MSGSEEDEDEDESGSGSGSDSEIEEQKFEDDEEIPVINVDVSNLNPLSPEVIQKQATINIGECGSETPTLCHLCRSLPAINRWTAIGRFFLPVDRSLTIH